MSFIDRLLGAAPGIAAQGIQAQRFGAEKRQKDLEAADDRNRAIQRDALQRSLLQQNYDENAQTAPMRRDLLGAQTASAQSEATLRAAQAAPGGFAPKAPVHHRSLKADKSGLLHSVDDETALDEQGRPVVERQPAAAQGPSDQLIYDAGTQKYVWVNPRTHAVSPAGDLAKGPTQANSAEQRADAQISISRHQIEAAATGLRQLNAAGKVPNDMEIANALKNPNLSIITSDPDKNRWFSHVAELATLEAAIRGRGGKGAIDQIKAALMRDPHQLDGAIADAEDGLARVSGGGQKGPGGDDADAKAAAYLANRRKKPTP